MNPWHAPPPPALLAEAPQPQQRTEADVQWVVGWIRDILVIAMSLANLLHLAAHG